MFRRPEPAAGLRLLYRRARYFLFCNPIAYFFRVQVLVEDFVSFSAAFQLIFGNADIHGNRIDGTCLKLYKRIVVIRELLQSGESIGEFFLTAFFLTL